MPQAEHRFRQGVIGIMQERRNALSWAAANGRIDVVRALLDGGGANEAVTVWTDPHVRSSTPLS
jgi:hypothetical protein